MAHLLMYTGARQHLAPGESRTFGRAETGRQLANVSRQQFRLEATAGGVQATSLCASNPTKVELSSSGDSILLTTGQSRKLAPGDRVLLLACDPSMWVEISNWQATTAGTAGTEVTVAAAAAAADGSAPGVGAGGENGRPHKRSRTKEQQRQQQQMEQPQQAEQQQAGRAAGGGMPPVVVLVLVGVQGSGKSTFCHSLMQRMQQEPGQAQQAGKEGQLQQAGEQPGSSGQQQQQLAGVDPSGEAPARNQQQQQQASRRWVRINQDSIAGPGRRGTKEQCLDAARLALQRGDSVLIDRTNVDQDQRRPFVRLAQQEGAQAHCLVLRLPKKTCMSRAAERVGHEGALEGKAVFPAISRMWSAMEEAGEPHTREGFSSVMICQSDGDVGAALEAWARFGPQHPDPVAEYECLKPPPPKQPVLNTLDRFFLKKPKAGSEGKQQQGQQGQQQAQQQAQEQQGNEKQAEQKRQQEGSPAQPAQPQQRQQQQALQPLPPAAVSRQSDSSSGGNALVALMAASRQQAKQGAGASPASKPADAATKAGTAGGSGGRGARPRHAFALGGPWANSLFAIASNPDSCRAEQPQLWYDQDCVLIEDKFPKARHHLLVVARSQRLQGPLDLTAADVPLVVHMLTVARQRAHTLRQADPSLRFRFGFHAAPSLRQLHMHVVSLDFDSPHLKNKKHWNSFTHPDFFLDADWVLTQLRQTGGLHYSLPAAEAALKSELRCHRCSAVQPSMPKLKQHIGQCSSPLPRQAE